MGNTQYTDYKSQNTIVATVIILLFATFGKLDAQITRFVKPVQSGSGDGSSWSNASSNIQAIINTSLAGDAIWVAAGIYKPLYDPFGDPSPADPRDKTFYLKDGVAIYGGFNGTENFLSERNIQLNTTILSGDLGNVGVNSDNCYHVVLSVFDNSSTKLDGFIIQDGAANPSSLTSIWVESYNIFRGYGGGINSFYGNILIQNCVIRNNSGLAGGGIYFDFRIKINKCIIQSNEASNKGGGFYCTNTYYNQDTITNCIFSNNNAALGAALFMDLSGVCILNSIFHSNNATLKGGFICIEGGPDDIPVSKITNCTIVNNNAPIQSGVAIEYTGIALLNNCIAWENSGSNPFPNGFVIFSYSIIQGGFPGTSNSAQNPLLVNLADPDGIDNIFYTADDGLSIQNSSPAINTGTITGAPLDDITGYIRLGNPDIGAYEYNIVFPIELTYFNGQYNPLGNIFEWETAFEYESDFFVLEQSDNMQKFTPVALIPAVGNSRFSHTYHFAESNTPPPSKQYYRLKLVDKNRAFNYSTIICINNNKGTFYQISPNPGTGLFRLHGDWADWSEIILFDIYGHQWKMPVIGGVIDISNYPDGAYFCKIEDRNKILTVRFLKIH